MTIGIMEQINELDEILQAQRHTDFETGYILDHIESPHGDHRIVDIRMRGTENWLTCACGWYRKYRTPERLAAAKAAHRRMA
jgi:hypothetical protein